MTTTAVRPAVSPDAPPGSHRPVASPRALARRWRLLAGVLAAVVAIGIVTAFVQGSESTRTFDPTSPAHPGSLAIASLLDERGVTVHLTATLPDSPTGTVFVPEAALLSDTELQALPDIARRQPVVVGSVGDDTLDLLGLIGSTDGATVSSRAPGCHLPAATVAGSARLGGSSYAVRSTRGTLTGAVRCYLDDDQPTLLQWRGDLGGSLTIVGTAQFLRNDQLARDGDAALALGLLSSRPTVTWVLPTESAPNDNSDGTPLSQLLPRGVLFGAGQLLVVILLLALWRGRRLGPVVREPLPVVVRAVETVRGRGRMYRAAKARDRAALALREAARARLAAALGMGAGTTGPALVDAVAARGGRPRAAVAALLYGPRPPADDAALVALADDLDLLSVTLSGRPGRRASPPGPAR